MQIDILDIIDVIFAPMEKAMKFFQDKGEQVTKHWNDLSREQHEKMFTVANMTDKALLSDVRSLVDDAISNGVGFEQFQADFRKKIAEKGWDVLEGETDKAKAARARVIWETNIDTAHAKARKAQMSEVAKLRPYWQWVHSHASKNPRASHQRLHGLILPHDSPFWRSNYPPCGFGCKCTVRTLSKRDLVRLGKTGPNDIPAWFKPDKGWEGPSF
jgi:SPP1 gp7 family putative phage head morphogenesis protein